MIVTRLQTSITLSMIVNKYVVNNITKFIQRKEIKCFLCNKKQQQKKSKIFDTNNNEKFFNYHLYDINNKRYFTSSSFISTMTTSIPSTMTTTMTTTTTTSTTPITTTTTTATTAAPIITENDSTDKKQVEKIFKVFKQLVESKKDELNNIETFPEFTNFLIKELIGSGIDDEMRSIMWIYDRFEEDNNNILTFETKNLIVLELLKYNRRKRAITIIQKLLKDDNYIPESSIIYELFSQSYDHLDLIKNLFNIIKKKENHQLKYHKLYTRIINLECSTKNLDNAVIYFNEMKEKMGIEPDKVNYLSLINGFARMDMMDKAEEYFNLMIQKGITPTIEIFTTLINHYLRLLNIERSEQLFQIMKSYNIKPNLITYNAIIHNSVIKLDMETAMKFFNEITGSGIKPDIITFSILLKGYFNAGDTINALQVNKMLKNYEIQPNKNYAMLLMKVYIQNGDLENAEKVFSSMIEQPTISNTTAITTTTTSLSDSIEFDIKSLTLYLKLLLKKTKDKNLAYELYKNHLNNFDNYKYKFTPDTYFFTTFISSFAQNYHDMFLAIEIFEEMKRREIKPSVVTYSILIDGFALKAQVDKAVEYYEKMKKDSIEPNVYTYTSLIKAWVQERNMDKTTEVYNEMISKDIQPVSATLRALQKLTSSNMQQILIDQPPKSLREAYYWGSKLWISKDIETVDRLFQSFLLSISNSLPFQNNDDKPNVKTFRYFITCYLFKYENLTKALEVFREMLKLNIKPDYILYCCLIKGCCMLGQFEKSIRFLDIMKIQKFVPNDYIYINLIKGWRKRRRLN